MNSKNFVKLGIFCIIAIASHVSARAQGYGWQYSARMPFGYSRLFGGVEISVGQALHTGELGILDGVLPCASYSGGKGLRMRLAAKGEMWLENGVTAVFGSFGFEQIPAEFTSLSELYPRRNLPPLQTEFVYSAQTSYASLEVGAKQRLFATRLHVLGSVSMGILVSKTAEQLERIVSPSDERFRDGSSSSVVSASGAQDISSLFLGVRAGLGYDIPLMKGVVCVPQATIFAPLTTMAGGESSWRRFDYSGSISLLFALDKLH